MADTKWQADIIVGIDFGMTCTGVAYTMGPEWPDPKTIQHWPGKLGHELRNKVDSTVSYDIETGNLTTWGFLCNPDDERFECNQYFKLVLDPDYKDTSEHAPSNEEAMMWYEDYLGCLYKYLIRHFSDTMPRFASKRIDFVFSCPVSWRRNPAMIARLEKVIRSAGFGRRESERSCVYLTEAEAAAISASKQSMIKGEVFLVCDAGGGTTDLNILKVECADKNRMELLPLSWTEGESVGSTLIDFHVRRIIRNRLMTIEGHIEGDVESVVARMMRDKFDTFKCSFGSIGMDVPKLFLPIPGMNAGLDFPQAAVEDSKMVITREQLQEIFDEQINKICSLIDKQLRLVQERHSRELVSYLVLSGGLGSSPYVQSRIKKRYEGMVGGLPGADDMKVIVAPEPQLSVVHGLVMARMQASRGGPDMYSTRCCPISFGILCREEYDPIKHQGETVVLDPFDNKRWAEKQINWVITQGQMVSANFGQRQRYRIKLPMGKERDPWKTRVVMSTLPVNQLPQSTGREGVKEVCAVEVVLDPLDMKRKNRHWYNFGKEYNRADFEVRMITGAGLRFEVWSKDGLRRSRDHDEIEVEWKVADGTIPPPPAPLEQGAGIYRW